MASQSPPSTCPSDASCSAEPAAPAEAPHPLRDLESACADLFRRWDTDMRAGKLLTALSAEMAPGYDSRVDRIRLALDAVPDLLAVARWARGCVPYPSDCHTAIVAAIAKATGQSGGEG